MQREKDFERVAEMYCRGVSQTAIAVEIGVTQQQIAHDLIEIKRRWQESSNANVEIFSSEEVAKINQLEKVAWEAWLKSCDEQVETQTRIALAEKDKDGNTKPPAAKTALRIARASSGDSKFLDKVSWCIEQRCKIRGITKADPSCLSMEQALGLVAALCSIVKRNVADSDTLQAINQEIGLILRGQGFSQPPKEITEVKAEEPTEQEP